MADTHKNDRTWTDSMPGIFSMRIVGDTLIGWLVRIVVVAVPPILMVQSGYTLEGLTWGAAALIETLVVRPVERVFILVVAFLIASALQITVLGWIFAFATFAEWFSDWLTPPAKDV